MKPELPDGSRPTLDEELEFEAARRHNRGVARRISRHNALAWVVTGVALAAAAGATVWGAFRGIPRGVILLVAAIVFSFVEALVATLAWHVAQLDLRCPRCRRTGEHAFVRTRIFVDHLTTCFRCRNALPF